MNDLNYAQASFNENSKKSSRFVLVIARSDPLLIKNILLAIIAIDILTLLVLFFGSVSGSNLNVIWFSLLIN